LGKYILKKIAYGFLVLFGVVTLVFFLQNSIGANPALLLGGNHATEENIASIEKDLGLDLPLYEQYFLYLNDISPISFHSSNPDDRTYFKEAPVEEVENSRSRSLDGETIKYDGVKLFEFGDQSIVIKYPYLRRSYQRGDSVTEVILDKLPDTAILAFFAVLIAFVLGVVFGVIAAKNKGSFFDNSSFMIAIAGMSTPSFFAAAIVSNVLGLVWAEESDLPLFPLVCMLFALMIGFAVLLFKNRQKDPLVKESVNWKKILTWGGKGFFVGLVCWLVYLIGYSIFGFENIPLIGETFKGPGTGLEPTGFLVEVDEYTAEEYYNWKSVILPAITLGVRPLAIVMQLMRSSMLDVLNEDYIRTAKAKGLSNFQITFKHALKNAMNPVVTAVSGTFASLLAGSVFVEKIFNWDGLGMTLIDAITNSDLPLILGITIFISAFFVIINILVDVIYGFLDPRIRLK
jgi:ABC-type dipeptide/oligopeptide/nickel transport system permease component